MSDEVLTDALAAAHVAAIGVALELKGQPRAKALAALAIAAKQYVQAMNMRPGMAAQVAKAFLHFGVHAHDDGQPPVRKAWVSK